MDSEKYIKGFDLTTKFINNELYQNLKLSRNEVIQMLAERIYNMSKINNTKMWKGEQNED